MGSEILITYPITQPAPYGGKDHGGRPSRHGAADGGASGRFAEATAEATADATSEAAGNAGRSLPANALATPREALQFRLQTETLPGPGSVAPFVAQQIGQLWIAPDPRIDHSHAAAAYRHANNAVDQYIAAALDRPLTA